MNRTAHKKPRVFSLVVPCYLVLASLFSASRWMLVVAVLLWSCGPTLVHSARGPQSSATANTTSASQAPAAGTATATVQSQAPDAGTAAATVQSQAPDAGAAAATTQSQASDAGTAAATVQYGKEIFVAPGGRDDQDGTHDRPFATLARAKRAIVDLKKLSGLPARGLVVWLRAGKYPMKATLELTSDMGGEAGKPIVISSYPGEEARLIGGQEIPATSFTKVPTSSPVWSRLDSGSRNNIFQADLRSAGIQNFGQLQVRGMTAQNIAGLEISFNRQTMQLARYPDDGANDASQGIQAGFLRIASSASASAFQYSGTRPERWTQAKDLWFHGLWYWNWADLHLPATRIDTAAKTITLAKPSYYGIRANQPYYAENLLEEITQPGEWYLDRDSGILYFWPPSDPQAGETLVSLLESPIISLSGASYVQIKDLSIELGRTTQVSIDGGAHNVLSGCKLLNGGTTGVLVSGEDNGIDRTEIAFSGDKAIGLDGGKRASLTSAGNYVKNSKLHNFARWIWDYQGAVSVTGVGQVISHNLIYDAPHLAIYYVGNNHLFEFNDIHDVCKLATDAGAIYSGRDWGYRGTVIQYNFIHDIRTAFTSDGQVHGVYLDDCLSGIKVFGNVIYRVDGDAILHGGGRDNVMENNIMAQCRGAALVSDNRGVSMINNTPGDSSNLLERLSKDGIRYQQEPWKSSYPALAAIPNDWSIVGNPSLNWLFPEGNVFSRNLGSKNAVFTVEYPQGSRGVFTFFAEMKDNVVDKDPLFVDEASKNLSLQPNSPALAIPGFKPIPFNQIGIQP